MVRRRYREVVACCDVRGGAGAPVLGNGGRTVGRVTEGFPLLPLTHHKTPKKIENFKTITKKFTSWAGLFEMRVLSYGHCTECLLLCEAAHLGFSTYTNTPLFCGWMLLTSSLSYLVRTAGAALESHPFFSSISLVDLDFWRRIASKSSSKALVTRNTWSLERSM